jgi:hypothetical protein
MSGRPDHERSAVAPRFTARDLTAFRHLRRFREALARAQEAVPAHDSFADPKRRLALGDYLCLFLMGLFNPVARTLRGLQQASGFAKMQREVCGRRVSLGSLSEIQHLVALPVLEHIFAELAAEVAEKESLPAALRVQKWMARDGSLFAALPRMSWALYGGGREGFVNNAVRLNLSYHLLKEAPVAAKITVGKACERAALREQIKAGDAYVGDRYYSEHYAFFAELSAKGCPCLIRLVEKTVATTVIEELPVTAEDRSAGVMRQAMVRLGSERTLSEVLRVIWLTGQSGQLLMLATSLTAEQLSAGDAALLYKHRWQVEYFFRWVKCLLGCGHWLAESPRGVAIQLYLALIGALLLQLDLGRRPSKRVWELLQWHQCGMLEDGELTPLLQRQLLAEEQTRRKAAAKKKS